MVGRVGERMVGIGVVQAGRNDLLPGLGSLIKDEIKEIAEQTAFPSLLYSYLHSICSSNPHSNLGTSSTNKTPKRFEARKRIRVANKQQKSPRKALPRL